jgi:hypothetical protein
MRDRIAVAVKFYGRGRRRRETAVVLFDDYRPHFVLKGDTDYLGVAFASGDDFEWDRELAAEVLLLYADVDYGRLVPNAEFFIMEGANAVGEGRVVDRVRE